MCPCFLEPAPSPCCALLPKCAAWALLLCLTAAFLPGCTRQAQDNRTTTAPSARQVKVAEQYGSDKLLNPAAPEGASTAPEPTARNTQSEGERFDPAAEEVVAREALAAWHMALAHSEPRGLSDRQWQAAKAADEKLAMSQLEELARRYPSASTVRFMMGQVKEHFGRKTEAVKYYEQATEKNRHSSMYVFKLARSLATAGNAREAAARYRQLLEMEPGCIEAMLGLSQSLLTLDANSKQAAELARDVLVAEPSNKQAAEILKRIGGKAGKNVVK